MVVLPEPSSLICWMLQKWMSLKKMRLGVRGGARSVVEGQGDDVLHVLGEVLEGCTGSVKVALVRQVHALEDGAL